MDGASVAETAAGGFSQDRKELLKRLLKKELRQAQSIKPYPRDERAGTVRAPASWAQQRLWFIDRLSVDNHASYHISLAFRLQGRLNYAALRKALHELVQRHETLRTTFIHETGELWQEIAAEGRGVLHDIDLSEHQPSERDTQLKLHKSAAACERFDLHTGPLIRGRLVRVHIDEHVLLLTLHHIVSDGWSLGILTRELADLYTAYQDGRTHQLPPLPLHYADYAQWQRQSLRGEILDKQLSYWRARLEGVAPQLDLPTDRARTEIQSYRGGSVEVVLDARLSAELKAFAQHHRMTLFMILCAGWAMLLARLSGQEDVVIGTPVANRQRPELEGLIGLFVNTLVLRFAVAGDARVDALLEHVKEVTVGAFDHQDMPFEQLVEALQPQRRLGRNPLFQAMLSWQDAAQIELRMPGLVVTAEDAMDEHSPFDLLLSLEERGNEIAGCLDYTAELFDAETVQQWMDCFPVLLKGMIDDATRRVDELPMLTPRERHRIVELFNATQAPYPRHKLIHELFERQAQRTPDAVAAVCDGRTLTYGQLNDQANRLARYLRQAHVGPGRRVGICVRRCLEMVTGLLGILKAGAAYVPLDPTYPPERLAYMLSDSAPLAVLTHAPAREVLKVALRDAPQPVTLIELDDVAAPWRQQSQENIDAAGLALTSQSLAYVIYTSGSTGRPKGIAVAHAPVINLVNWVNSTFQVGPGDSLLFVTSICFDLSVYDIFGTLAAGGRICIANEESIHDPQQLAGIIYREGITFWDSAPAALQLLVPYLRSHPTPEAPLRLIFNSGDWIPLSLPTAMASAFPKARFISLGGATEATVWSNWYEVRAVMPGWKSIPYGRPIQNSRYYILDAALQPIPIGVAGDLYIAGECLANGYTDDALSRERFVTSPFAANDRLYKTGDRARYFADGNIEFLGRNDFQVKIRGFRVELGEIEARLLEHPKLSEAVVVAREDVPGDQRLVAYYIAKHGVELTAEQLKAHLSSTLANYMVPAAYMPLTSLPLTPNGKLDRKALPAPDTLAYGARHHTPPQGALEIALAKLWSEVLQADSVGRDDNFFERGGHSLLAVKLMDSIAAQFAVNLSVTTIFRCPTLRQLAQVVAAARSPVIQPPVVIPELEAGGLRESPLVPLSFAQLYRWHCLPQEERPFRQLARAMRLHGLVDIALFNASVAHAVQRHEALRSRIIVLNQTPVQEVAEFADYELERVDLTTLTTDQREEQVQRSIERLIEEPIDLAAGPLFGARMLRLQADEHVFMVALHWLIADGFSMNLLMRDIFDAYLQLSARGAATLPAVPVQLADYAVWQRKAQPAWQERHVQYWNDRMAGCRRVGFPFAITHPGAGEYGAATVPVRIDGELTAQLREWCRAHQTTLVMGAFTAYAALVLRWCGVTDAVLRFQTNGRTQPQVQNTIGVFASILNLRLRLLDADCFGDLLQRVTLEYCNAAEHADASRVDAQLPRLEFTYNSVFNWVPSQAKHELAAATQSQGALTCSPVAFSNPLLSRFDSDDEPSILLSDTDAGIAGDVYFSLNRFPKEVIERFARNFSLFVTCMVSQPQRRVQDIELS